jgi:hypothetical protein
MGATMILKEIEKEIEGIVRGKRICWRYNTKETAHIIHEFRNIFNLNHTIWIFFYSSKFICFFIECILPLCSSGTTLMTKVPSFIHIGGYSIW